MRSFTIRWRASRQHREIELAAGEDVAVPLMGAMEASGGLAVWQTGTLWKCPGCGDRTVKTEEFLEGMHRAEQYLQRQNALEMRETSPNVSPGPALAWLQQIGARMLGCERDRVYIKDESGGCAYQNASYTSRI
jgi:hypothetical protein